MPAGRRWRLVGKIPERLLILTTLLLGFGLIFALWLFSTYRILGQLSEVDAQVTAITRRLSGSAEAEEGQADLSAIYRLINGQSIGVTAVTLLGSLLIAALATRETWLLESRLRRQLEKDAQNTRDLRELSARLVAAQEQERRLIGLELHDEIGQALTAIKVQLALAERREAGANGEAADLARLKTIADRALQSVREVSRMLSPLELEDLGLPDAVKSYVREFAERTGVSAVFTCDDFTARLPREVEVCAYRILQEALTNVTRHAGAASCRVELRKRDGGISLVVEDDGGGFDPGTLSNEHPRQGLGLLGMQERVNAFRGSFRLDSSPGRGTRVTVELPDTQVLAHA